MPFSAGFLLWVSAAPLAAPVSLHQENPRRSEAAGVPCPHQQSGAPMSLRGPHTAACHMVHLDRTVDIPPASRCLTFLAFTNKIVFQGLIWLDLFALAWLFFFPRSIYLTAGKRGSLQRWQLGSWQGCGHHHSGHAGGSSWRPRTPRTRSGGAPPASSAGGAAGSERAPASCLPVCPFPHVCLSVCLSLSLEAQRGLLAFLRSGLRAATRTVSPVREWVCLSVSLGPTSKAGSR